MDSTKNALALDKQYQSVEKIILSRQDPITGLLPASTAINAHGDYTDAWVRDNVYSILSVWGLSLAYKKEDATHPRGFLLGQSVVKLMRGLLLAMMQQAHKVEAFKNSLDPLDALHAKYGTSTGLPVVEDDAWGHLQLDATSLFLLMLAQMTASGLKIIYTKDEVDFIQNLVHYISHTYCTPDYGIWERGNKINHGTTEINGSSVGMAKAALEAMDGFNLFGEVETQEGIIHVVPSDIARSCATLEDLLPRESNSKETDAALLSIIGYPAYAVEKLSLVERTRNKIIKKLSGNYGCKRFLLDGHQSSIEDPNRLHYEPSELHEFANIESEWPLFFTYLLLDALMREDSEAIRHWQAKLTPLFVEEDGEQLLPELYIVPKASIALEKANPKTQTRIPNENIPLVWAQSLYILSNMIIDGLLSPEDIDPMGRRDVTKRTHNKQPLVPILAENESVKDRLTSLGFFSQTIQEIRPIRVVHASFLSQLHTHLGENNKLGLKGRPYMVTRTITSSSMHQVGSEVFLSVPYYFNPQGFYFSYDNTLLAEHFRASLKFLSKQWNKSKQPMLPFIVRESMLVDEQQDAIVALLGEIVNQNVEGVILETGRVADLLPHANIEKLNAIEQLNPTLYEITPHQTISEVCCNEQKSNQALDIDTLTTLETLEDATLIQKLVESENNLLKVYLLRLLWRRHGNWYEIETKMGRLTLTQVAEQLYLSATLCLNWGVVRRLAELTKRYDERLEDILLDIVIRQKRLAVGRAYSEDTIFTQPSEAQVIIKTIWKSSGNNSAEAILTQEVILHLGYLIRSEPELFENILTLRTWYFIQLLVGQLSRTYDEPIGEAYERLLSLAPHLIYQRLRKVLKAFTQEAQNLHQLENIDALGKKPILAQQSVPEHKKVVSESKDWTHWREEKGMIGYFSKTFYKDIWYLLRQCDAMVIGDKYTMENRLDKMLIMDTTAGERSFAIKIDRLLQKIEAPEYRQLTIEAIESMAWLFKQNPSFLVSSDLIIDAIIGHAVRIHWSKLHPLVEYNEHKAEAWHLIYTLSPIEVDELCVEAFMYLLTQEKFEQ